MVTDRHACTLGEPQQCSLCIQPLHICRMHPQNPAWSRQLQPSAAASGPAASSHAALRMHHALLAAPSPWSSSPQAQLVAAGLQAASEPPAVCGAAPGWPAASGRRAGPQAPEAVSEWLLLLTQQEAQQLQAMQQQQAVQLAAQSARVRSWLCLLHKQELSACSGKFGWIACGWALV